MNSLIKKKFQVLNFYQKGENPRLLIHSGTHGDEFEIIPFIKSCLNEYSDKLPDFIYIPEVSPSAVKLKTRLNKSGLDINRSFFNDTKDEEVRANINLHKKFKFDFFVDFHEDPELDEFYIYDSGKFSKQALFEIQSSIESIGVELFNGIDDPSDPVLGHKFNNGYKSFKGIQTDPMTGTFWDWSEINGKIGRIIVVEIPGKLPVEKKGELINIIFRKIVLPLV